MLIGDSPSGQQLPIDPNYKWYRELTRYHWFVLIVAALGWLFDTMDQQLFTLARQPTMKALIPLEIEERSSSGEITKRDRTDGDIKAYSGYATSIFLMGWAAGGLIFGVLGDRIGRAKTMLWTILFYSAFTGLSALSQNFWQFSVLRFLTGLGVGGEFAVGVALVAEVMPDRARPHALGLLQALSAVGNITAALIEMGLGQMERFALVQTGERWRIMFLIGTLPALLAVVIRARLKEPERWQSVSHDGKVTKQLGSYRELFSDPRWRKNAIVGLTLAFSGVVGLWAIGFFSVELIDGVLRKHFTAEGLVDAELNAAVSWNKGIGFILQQVGGALGIYMYSKLSQRLGRRIAFAFCFIIALISTAATFAFLDQYWEVFWMLPLMGFCQLSLFGGYAIYFPELFPTRLRSTGISFCYNVGRFVAALGPSALGLLVLKVFNPERGYPVGEGLRYAGVTMCAVFLIGLFALPFAPETRGKPLPE